MVNVKRAQVLIKKQNAEEHERKGKYKRHAPGRVSHGIK